MGSGTDVGEDAGTVVDVVVVDVVVVVTMVVVDVATAPVVEVVSDGARVEVVVTGMVVLVGAGVDVVVVTTTDVVVLVGGGDSGLVVVVPAPGGARVVVDDVSGGTDEVGVSVVVVEGVLIPSWLTSIGVNPKARPRISAASPRLMLLSGQNRSPCETHRPAMPAAATRPISTRNT